MNLPNRLTLFRVCTIPFFVIFMEFDIFSGFDKYIAVALFIIASITDALDGHIARKYNLVTNFGKFMDLSRQAACCSSINLLERKNTSVDYCCYY